MKKTLITVLVSALLVAVGIVVGMRVSRPADIPDTPAVSPVPSIDTLSAEPQEEEEDAETPEEVEEIDTSNAQDLSHDKLWQYFEWIYHDLGYTFGYDNLAKPEMIEEQYTALQTRFKDFFDISEYKLPDNYKSEYNKFLSETLQVFGVTVDLETEKPVDKGSEQKTNNTTTQKPVEQKPAETQKPVEQKPTVPKQVEQKPSEQKPVESKPTAPKQTEQKLAAPNNSSNKSYIEELREMYPGISDADLLSLFGDPSKEVDGVHPEYESGLFGG